MNMIHQAVQIQVLLQMIVQAVMMKLNMNEKETNQLKNQN